MKVTIQSTPVMVPSLRGGISIGRPDAEDRFGEDTDIADSSRALGVDRARRDGGNGDDARAAPLRRCFHSARDRMTTLRSVARRNTSVTPGRF